MPDSILSIFIKPPLSYILLVAIIIIACYFVFKKLFKDKPFSFKGENIDYVIKELNLNKSFINFSRKCKKGLLYYNLGSIKIERVMEASLKIKNKTDKKIENMKYILFQTTDKSIGIPIIGFLFNKKQYFLIDNDKSFIKKDKYRDIWNINPNVFLHKFADVWISSESGTNFLTELIYKRTYENAREEEMNYIKRVVWYNDKTASLLTKDILEHDLKQDSYEKRIERETGVTKK